MLDLTAVSEKVGAETEALRKGNTKSTNDVHEKRLLATMKSARAKPILQESVSVKAEPVVCRAKRASSCWKDHGVAEIVSKVEEGVSYALTVVSGKATNVTIRKVSVIEMELLKATNRVSTWIETETQANIFRIRTRC